MNHSKAETAIFVAHDDYIRRDPAEAEKNLMRAVLQCAMDDFRKRGEPYRDAFRYFTSKDDFYLYSFLSCCYHLNLCPRTVLNILGLREVGGRMVVHSDSEVSEATIEAALEPTKDDSGKIAA